MVSIKEKLVGHRIRCNSDLSKKLFIRGWKDRLARFPNLSLSTPKVTQIIKNQGVNENDRLLRPIFFSPFTAIAANVRLPCRGDTQPSSDNTAWCWDPTET